MTSFSIITPVYNGEKYIANCINAIVGANYDLSKIEHIIVANMICHMLGVLIL